MIEIDKAGESLEAARAKVGRAVDRLRAMQTAAPPVTPIRTAAPPVMRSQPTGRAHG